MKIFSPNTLILSADMNANFDEAIKRGVPIGTVIDFAGSSAPTNFILANGASLLRADYASLFGVIGTTYGAVDGTHFTLPDLQNRVSVGKGSGSFATLGAVGGAETIDINHRHDHSHNHSVNINTGGEWNNGGQSSNTNNSVGYGPPAHNHNVSGWTSDASNGPYGLTTNYMRDITNPINKMPPYQVLLKCIKYQ